jgi:3D (Asp-Asp-Asp) domain-containing protein
MVLVSASGAFARGDNPDPIGDMIGAVAARVEPFLETFGLKATLYHLGAHGIGGRDSLGCKVVPMRTAAVDGVAVKRRTVLFIKETVGLPMPDGHLHDGYWYATDIGGAIHRGRIDLYTGTGAASMAPLIPLNLATLTVTRVGEFTGCPSPASGGAILTTSVDHRGDMASLDGGQRPGGSHHLGVDDEGLGHIFGRNLLSQ